MQQVKKLTSKIIANSTQKLNWHDENLIRFIHKVSSYKVLSDKETKSLIKALRSGDETARDKIFNGNIRIILYILKSFNLEEKSIISFSDLIQEGSIGLLEAIDKFDLSKDVTFMNYAVFWVYKLMYKCIYQNNWAVSIPENQVRIKAKIKRYQDIMEDIPFVKLETLAKELKVSIEMLQNLLLYGTDVTMTNINIEESIADDNEDIIENVEQHKRKEDAIGYLQYLNEKDKKFIYATFNLDCDMTKEEKKDLLSRYSKSALAIKKYRILNKLRMMICTKNDRSLDEE